MPITKKRMPARYGVAAERLPRDMRRTCWIIEPPDLPSGLPITSTAALPLVFSSGLSGMYASSLHGSKREYFDDFDIMFCAAPTSTASISGVVPSATATGFHMPGARMSEKNAAAVASRTAGVTMAAAPHERERIWRPMSIIMMVTAPVADENLPMKPEYAEASGKASRSRPFHVTSTMLIDMPYAITMMARLRMYGEAARWAADSLSDILVLVLDFLAAAGSTQFGSVMTFLVTYRWQPSITPPDASTAVVRSLRVLPYTSPPIGVVAAA
mmetsp:Transcript_32791/g.75854  ORF Transcript_32791/g.75854 Transcript_32791/m.75854 type:complete len:271 (+) Transcript_32791:558-1370(+)